MFDQIPFIYKCTSRRLMTEHLNILINAIFYYSLLQFAFVVTR